MLPVGLEVEEDPDRGVLGPGGLPRDAVGNPLRMAPCCCATSNIAPAWITGCQLDKVPELLETGMLDRFADPAGTHDITIMIAGREIRLKEPNRPGGRWARVWPAAVSLAETIAMLNISNQRVLELGCGLGLPSVVAAQRGAIVTVTDVEPEAVKMAIENAQRAGVHVDGVVADWRSPERLVERAPFDLVIAADVVYFEYALDALTALLPRLVPPGGLAIVTAPADARTRGTSVVDVFGEQFDIDARPDPERGELMVHRLRPVSRQWTGTRDT